MLTPGTGRRHPTPQPLFQGGGNKGLLEVISTSLSRPWVWCWVRTVRSEDSEISLGPVPCPCLPFGSKQGTTDTMTSLERTGSPHSAKPGSSVGRWYKKQGTQACVAPHCQQTVGFLPGGAGSEGGSLVLCRRTAFKGGLVTFP